MMKIKGRMKSPEASVNDSEANDESSNRWWWPIASKQPGGERLSGGNYREETDYREEIASIMMWGGWVGRMGGWELGRKIWAGKHRKGGEDK